MTLATLEFQISASLLDLKEKVAPENYNQWVNFFLKVKDSALVDSEKKRKYIILIETIEAYNQALYLNSPLTIIKDSLRQTVKDVVKLPMKVLNEVKFPLILGLVIVFAIIVWVKK